MVRWAPTYSAAGSVRVCRNGALGCTDVGKVSRFSHSGTQYQYGLLRTGPVISFTLLASPLPGQFSWNPADRALTLAVLAQSLATLRCCSLARDVVILADIFEEEDFYPSTFGFRLAPPVEDDSLTDLLALAEGAMRERVSVQQEPAPLQVGAISTDSRLVRRDRVWGQWCGQTGKACILRAKCRRSGAFTGSHRRGLRHVTPPRVSRFDSCTW